MSRRIIRGSELQVFINDAAPAWCTSHTMTKSAETTSTVTKDHGINTNNAVTALNWELTGEFLFSDNDYDMFFDLFSEGETVSIKFCHVANYSTQGLIRAGGDVEEWLPSNKSMVGQAIITNLTANANAGETATFSVTFTGTGALNSVTTGETDYFIAVTYDAREVEQGMRMFNASAAPYVASVVYVGSEPTEVQVLNGVLQENITGLTQDPNFIIYLANSTVPAHMFENLTTVKAAYTDVDVNVIGAYAFANVTSLTTVATNADVTEYKDHCFDGCTSLASFNINSDVNYINASKVGASAFNTCVRLGDIALGDACTEVQAGAFNDCVQMTNVNFSDSITSIGNGAFSTSSHTSPKTFEFYDETAPTLGTYPLGNLGYQVIILHGVESVNDWLESNETWDQYENADIRLAD
jgi:hypothetical protein